MNSSHLKQAMSQHINKITTDKIFRSYSELLNPKEEVSNELIGRLPSFDEFLEQDESN
jgi:hypothetical protein